MSKRSDDRIKALREDPGFKALVTSLRKQKTEQVEAFIEHLAYSESTKPGRADDDQE